MDAHHEHTSMLTGIELDHPYAENPTTVLTHFVEEDDLNASFYCFNESMDTDCTRDMKEEVHIAAESQKKFIVFENCLDTLFRLCPECSRLVLECDVKKVLKGSFLTVTYTCSQGHVNTWYSQSLLNRVPAGNLLLSAGILFSGSTYAKLSQLANILAIMAERTFYSIQAKYLFPVVHETWVSHKKEIYSGVRGSN